MIVVWSLVYLVTCAIFASRFALLARSANVVGDGHGVAIAWMLGYAVVFLAGYLLAGIAELVTGWNAVRVESACVFAAGLLVGLLRWTRFRVQPIGERDRARLSMRSRLAKGGLGAVAAATSVVVICTLVFMVSLGYPRGFEVIAYHLPLAVHILQGQTLKPWDAAYMHAFPLNASILYSFFLGLVPERAISVVSATFLVPLAFALYGGSRAMQADRSAALLICAGLISIPMVLFSSLEASADIAGAAFLAIAVFFLLTAWEGGGIAMTCFVAGLAAGVAFGFKSLHLVSALWLALWAFALGFARSGHAGWNISAGAKAIASFAIGWMVMSGFWLLRNWVAFGNPLYPVRPPLIADWLQWPAANDFSLEERAATQYEWVRAPLEWLTYPWIEWHFIGQNFKHSSGLGAFFACVLPATVVAVLAGIASNDRERLKLALAFGGAVWVTAIWWLLGDRQPRYVMGAIVFLLPLSAWSISRAEGLFRQTYVAVAAVCIAAMLAIFFLMEGLRFGDRIILSKGYDRQRYYEYPTGVDSLPRGSTILNLGGRTWHYPLAGRDLANRVVSLPEAIRILGLNPADPGKRVTLLAEQLRLRGVTHVFADGVELHADPCIELSSVSRLDINPLNSQRLSSPRILYAVRYCE